VIFYFLLVFVLEIWSCNQAVSNFDKILFSGFVIEDNAPNNHKFMLTMFQPTEPKLFFQTVSKEHKLLKNSLPEGICVKGYENRMVIFEQPY
jgi:hypothetical protein